MLHGIGTDMKWAVPILFNFPRALFTCCSVYCSVIGVAVNESKPLAVLRYGGAILVSYAEFFALVGSTMFTPQTFSFTTSKSLCSAQLSLYIYMYLVHK